MIDKAQQNQAGILYGSAITKWIDGLSSRASHLIGQRIEGEASALSVSGCHHQHTAVVFTRSTSAQHMLPSSVANSSYNEYTNSSLKIYQIYTKLKYVTKNNNFMLFSQCLFIVSRRWLPVALCSAIQCCHLGQSNLELTHSSSEKTNIPSLWSSYKA